MGTEENAALHNLLRQHGSSRKGVLKPRGLTGERPHEKLVQNYRGLLALGSTFIWLPYQ